MTTQKVDSARDRIAGGCDRIAFSCLVTLVILLPLALNPQGNAYFDLPKMVVVRLAAMLGAAAWAAGSISRQRFDWIRTPLDWPILALCASGAVTTLLAINRHTSLYGGLNTFDGLLNMTCHIVFFYLAVNFVDSRRRLAQLVTAFVGTAGLVSLVAILERAAPGALPWPLSGGGVDPTRSSATFGNPIHLGAYLTLVLPIALSVALYCAARLSDPDEPARDLVGVLMWIAGAITALSATAMLFTKGRAAWLGGTVGILTVIAVQIVAALRKRRDEGRSPALRQVVLIILAVAATAVLYTITSSGPQAPRGESVAQRAGAVAEVGSGTGFNRVYMWKMTLPMVAARPLSTPVPNLDATLGPSRLPMSVVRPIFGYGFDSYLQLFPKWRPPDWYRAIKEDAVPAQPHNDLLHVAVGQGLVGLAAYLTLLAVLFFTVGRSALCATQPTQHYALAGLLGATAGYVVQLQASFSVVGVAALFWTTAGLAVSLALGKERAARRVRVRLPTRTNAVLASLCVALAALIVWGVMGLYASFAADRALRAAQDAFAQGAYPDELALLDSAANLSPREARFPMVAARMSEDTYLRTKATAYADAALRFARRAQQLDPYLTEPFFTEASIDRDLAGRTGKDSLGSAAALYRHVLAIDRYNEDALLNLGLTMYDLNSYAQAVSLFRQAVRLKPRDGDAYEALGAALVKLGRTDEAVAALERALELNPDRIYARRQLEALRRKARENPR